jgi:site-specific DNA-methyltransferase (adenine-specific)
MKTANTETVLPVFDYPHKNFGDSVVINCSCFEWALRVPPNSIHAIVTDPPYGLKEFDLDELEKRKNGHGGIWRIPPSFDGHTRSPLPRFTALNKSEREVLSFFFENWSRTMLRILRPGAHVIVASNAFISQLTYSSIVQGGLEYRGEIIRIVRTLRGGDRPKNAEDEFPDCTTMPRGNYEPWGLFRKPIPDGMRVMDCLRRYQTGALRRNANGTPFADVISSERTPRAERRMSCHPSLKPQSYLRQTVWASLPLGKGVVLDPFMGSGSTVAAARSLGYSSVGIELNREYYEDALQAIPKLSRLANSQIPAISSAHENQLVLL